MESKVQLKASVFSPKTNSPVVTVTNLKEVYRAIKDGDIVRYENNRGTKGVRNPAVKKIANEFDPICLGLLQVAVKNGKLELCDFHHRADAIEFVVENYGIDFLEDALIPVKIYHETDFMKIYAKTNTNQSQTLAEKTSCVDLPLGNYLASLCKKAEVSLSATQTANLADIAIAYSKNKTSITLQDVFQSRGLTRDFASQIEGEINDLTEASAQRLVLATKYYNSIVGWIKDFQDKDRVNAKVLMNTPGFMMYIIVDYLSADPRVAYLHPAEVAYYSMSNSERVIEEVQAVARRNAKHIDEKNLVNYLTGNYARGSQSKLKTELGVRLKDMETSLKQLGIRK